MDRMATVYRVRVPILGQPEPYRTLVRALTPEMAGEVVRVLLAADDPEVTSVLVEVAKELISERG